MQPIVTVTPLKPHGSRYGGLIAALLLASASAVVWVTHPAEPPRPAAEPPARPAASAAALPAPLAAPPAVRSFELRTGIATTTVVARSVRRQVTGAGTTAYDDTRTSHVVAPVSGWFEKSRTSWLGRRVRPGEPLGTVHSLEVYLASADLVAKIRGFESQAQVDAARDRLARWSMPRNNLERIERRLQPETALPLVPRVAGTVVADLGTSRQLVEPAEMFTVTDPTRSWAFVELAADDAARVRVGMPATLAVEGSARTLPATVSYVWRRAENGRRTVRFDLYTPRARVEPDLAVTATLTLDAETLPVIPASAVRQLEGTPVVFVVRGQRVEARDVVLGAAAGAGPATHSVVGGLSAGETIVVDAAQL